MIARSSALTSAGLLYTDERGSASNRHCCDIGSAGFMRSTIACRSPGSVAELSCQKIIFDLQLADLPVQKIDLHFIGGCLRRRAAFEHAHRPIQQLLLPVVDLVRVHSKMRRQLCDRPVAPDCRYRHLGLERCAVLLPSLLHLLLPRYPRFLGAGLHLATCLIFGVQLNRHVARRISSRDDQGESTTTRPIRPHSFWTGSRHRLREDEKFLRALVRAALQEVLEAEMTE